MPPPDPSPQASWCARSNAACRVAVAYFLLSAAWIVFSDLVWAWAQDDVAAGLSGQMLKGLVFVAASALVIFGLVAYQLRLLLAREQELRYQAHHDALTGLGNRYKMAADLAAALAQASAAQTRVTAMLLGLDHFKLVNDSLGHHTGDDLLCLLAQRLSSQLPPGFEAYRLGSDEFVVLGPAQDVADALQQAERLRHLAEAPFALPGQAIHTSVTIGLSVFPDSADNADMLLRHADAAFHDGKRRGRNCVSNFDAQMASQAEWHLALHNDLQEALSKQQLFVVYQPQIAIANGALVGVEALLRWQHPQRGLVSPADFIPVAESTALINEIGAFVLRESCQQILRWEQQGVSLRVAVNLSARQFRQPNLARQLMAMVAEAGVDPTQLEFEVTESALMDDADDATRSLQELKAQGFRIAIDDFGTGYSSLAYLRRFDVDVLKIDQSFVHNMLTDPDDAAIARTVVALGHSIGLEVLAEGVEQPEQLAFLADCGCDVGQGYWWLRPAAPDEITRLVQQGTLPLPAVPCPAPQASPTSSHLVSGGA